MSTIKLTYFPIGGRAEATRLSFVINGVKFEDDHVVFPKFQEWRDSHKELSPLGQLPALTVTAADGTVSLRTQSMAMLRYAGRLGDAKLYPSDVDAALRVDEVLDVISDLSGQIGKSMRMPEEEKVVARKELAEVTLPKYLGLLALRKGTSKFIAGDTLTVADVAVACSLKFLTSGMLDHVPVAVAEGYPTLIAVRDAVFELDAVKAWYAAKK